MDQLQAGESLGPYRIVSFIASGGMGSVYRAHDPRTGRDVAIKLAAEQFSERFSREVRAVAALNHQNICTLYDVGPNYLVMELVDGETPIGPLPLETTLNYAKQIAEALEAAHEKGIVHRDLKPGNIKIKPDGTVKVLDFGLAKVGGAPTVKSEDSPTLSLAATQAGVILGTAAYMSPEQARGKTVDKRADIWAFGVVLYELLTGKQPFQGEDITETLAAVVKEQPDFTRVPHETRRLLQACLEKDARKRLQSISDWRLLLDDAPVTAPVKSRFSVVGWVIASVAIVALSLALWAPWRSQPVSPNVVRFQIPGKSSGSRPFFDYSVSPDGRYLAYVGPDGGTWRLWLQPLDSIGATPLAGTELPTGGGPPNFPFWSPDSRFVVFMANGRLKKVDITGGLPQTICDFPENSALTGGSWSRDGVILFGVGQTTGGVMRVAASGGTASSLVKNDLASGLGGQDFPSLLPDGSHFLYYKHYIKRGSSGIYVGSLEPKPEAQEPKQLLATDSAAVVVPSQNSDGLYILFIRENIIFAQRFDVRRLEVTGEPLPIAYQEAGTSFTPWFSASNNGVLIYRGGLAAGAGEKLQPTWFDRKGKDAIVSLQRDSYGFLSTMSDGTRLLASIIEPAKFVSDLWVFDLTRGVSNRLTTSALGFSASPVWSPDGLQIAYGSNHGAGPYDLYLKAANGTGAEQLLYKSDSTKFPTSWSRDGRYLLYQADATSGKPDLWVLSMEGERKPSLYLRAESNTQRRGQFSPDGNFVAYEADESGKFEVYVRPFPDPSKGKWPVSNGGGISPRWRSDGKELFYLGPDQSVMAVDVSTTPVFQLGARHALFKLPPQVVTFDVTGDGNKFLAAVPTATENSATPFNVVLNWQAALKK